MENVVGHRLRQARMARQLSLNDVAGRAKISVATLSRIERDKQGLGLGLFLSLTRILKAPPQDLLGEGNGSEEIDPLAVRIASRRVAQLRHISQQIEELLAQVECMRVEIEAVYKRLRRA